MNESVIQENRRQREFAMDGERWAISEDALRRFFAYVRLKLPQLAFYNKSEKVFSLNPKQYDLLFTTFNRHKPPQKGDFYFIDVKLIKSENVAEDEIVFLIDGHIKGRLINLANEPKYF